MRRIILPALILIVTLACTFGQLPQKPTQAALAPALPATQAAAAVAAPPTNTPPSLDDRLIAYYPLAADANDLTGKNAPLKADNAPFQAGGGIYCNGMNGLPGSCDVFTPGLNGLNFSAFTISARFLLPEPWDRPNPVFVGGRNYRWLLYELKPKGVIQLVSNGNQAVDCTVHYQTGVWHEAAITYDGQTATLYLDGTAGCSAKVSLQTGDDRSIHLTDFGSASTFRGFFSELKVYNSVVVPAPSTPQAADLTVPLPANLSPADVFLMACPSSGDVAAVDAALKLTFEGDQTSADGIACTAAQSSRDLTHFQKRVYNTILLMKKIQFAQPLPWTKLQLYDWFVAQAKGVRFRSDITLSHCCEPERVLNIQTGNLIVNTTDRWIEPAIGDGVRGFLVLLVHEARHAEGYPHTCGPNDKTLEEMGAWGAQVYLNRWLADHLSDPAFFASPDLDARQYALGAADDVLKSNFCLSPTPVK